MFWRYKMTDENFELAFRDGTDPSDGEYPGHKPGTRLDERNDMVCEYDVGVTMRDGTTIYIDCFRPAEEDNYPPLIVWGPYGKHYPDFKRYENRPGSGIPDADLSEYTIYEGPDPLYWCQHGYAIIHADPRGAWGSEGDLTFMTEQEAQDCYDLIEWAGEQDWSNGKVGMSGVSYLAWTQWQVAALDPPHLEAINPWEGVTDFYRELAFHGGIPFDMWPNILEESWCYSQNRVEDITRMREEHQLFDEYWASKNPDLSEITVPAYVSASWSDHSCHTRGTLEGFKEISSEHKWLRVHGRKKWQDFYQEEERQRQFFDMFLKGIESETRFWPTVEIEIRDRYYKGEFRGESEWPLERTDYTELFLNAADGSMNETPFESEERVRYSVDQNDGSVENASFEHTFNERTELTGHMKLKLWVKADGSDDMDLFVAIDKFDRTGDRVPLPFHSILDNGPIALGWLRVSQRELDEERSEPYQPVLKHTHSQKLDADEIVPVDVEIWPSSTLFKQGETIRVTVQGSDIYRRQNRNHSDTVNEGHHLIYTGGEYDSHLLVPMIP